MTQREVVAEQVVSRLQEEFPTVQFRVGRNAWDIVVIECGQNWETSLDPEAPYPTIVAMILHWLFDVPWETAYGLPGSDAFANMSV